MVNKFRMQKEEIATVVYMYIKGNNIEDIMYLLVYVDDILIITENEEFLQNIIDKISKLFKI